MSLTCSFLFEDEPSYIRTSKASSLIIVHLTEVELASPLAPFGQISHASLDLTGPMRHMDWPELTAKFVFATQGNPHIHWDAIVPDDNTFFDTASKKCKPTFNPQYLIECKVPFRPVSFDPEEDPTTTMLKVLEPRPIPSTAKNPLSQNQREYCYYHQIQQSQILSSTITLKPSPSKSLPFHRHRPRPRILAPGNHPLPHTIRSAPETS